MLKRINSEWFYYVIGIRDDDKDRGVITKSTETKVSGKGLRHQSLKYVHPIH